MRDDEKNILTHRLKYFVEDIFPVDLLPSLTCLTTSDREQIQRDQDRHGDRRATDTLVDRLKRRKDGFPQFVNSLRENGSEHVAMLLDPEMKGENMLKYEYFLCCY